MISPPAAEPVEGGRDRGLREIPMKIRGEKKLTRTSCLARFPDKPGFYAIQPWRSR